MIMTERVRMLGFNNEIIFLCTDSILGEEEFQRLKHHINECWPKNGGRPILLEGGLKPVKFAA